MKVLMLLDNSCRYDSRVLREASALTAAHHDVRIIAFLDKDTQPLEQKNGFRIIRIIARSTTKRSYLWRFFRSWYYWITYCRRTLKLLHHEPADVYHCHDLFTLPTGCIAKLFQGGKLVYDSHELFTEQAHIKRHLRLLFKIVERLLIRYADRVITVNEFIARELARRYRIPVPAVLLNCPSALAPDTPPPLKNLRHDLNLPDATPIILYIGGYALGRGLHNVILAARHLHQGIIVFMGYGPHEAELKRLIKDEGLQDKVVFNHPVTPDELIAYISTASLGMAVFKAVDLNTYYVSPNKLFEYINAGLPVVCSDFPFMQNLVEQYQLGKSCNPDDPKDIADAINWVLSDDKYRELKSNALKAARIFNWENESPKLIALYRELETKITTKS